MPRYRYRAPRRTLVTAVADVIVGIGTVVRHRDREKGAVALAELHNAAVIAGPAVSHLGATHAVHAARWAELLAAQSHCATTVSRSVSLEFQKLQLRGESQRAPAVLDDAADVS